MKKVNLDLYRCKGYLHIDKQVSIHKVKNYIVNPEKIAHHSFLPFLCYDKVSEKYVGYGPDSLGNRPVKQKIRTIMYAGHLDSYIYKYYSNILNIYYNEWITEAKLDKYSVAYRTNRKHQSNINFAAEAISFIEKQSNSYIIVGDFKNFFDTLDHKLLKERLAKILNVKQLPPDWYNIYKSLTKFAYIDKDTLNNSDNPLVQKNNISYFKCIRDFRKFQKQFKCKLNKNSYGIPQGNSLSGILANIYAIDFDKCMSEISQNFNGFYQRYSDDFILVLNIEELSEQYGDDYIEKVNEIIANLSKTNRIYLQVEKIKTYFFKDKIVKNHNDKVCQIDYLGFSFDGKNVSLREKSIYKFYRNARKLIYDSKILQKRKGLTKLPNRHKIYSLYTDFGKSKHYRSNFISYAKRSQYIFDKISPNTNNLMVSQLKNRKKKIESALGYRIHSRIEKSNK